MQESTIAATFVALIALSGALIASIGSLRAHAKTRLLDEATKAAERARERREQAIRLAADGAVNEPAVRILQNEAEALDRAARSAERQYARSAAPAVPTLITTVAWGAGSILFLAMAATEFAADQVLDVTAGIYVVGALTYGALAWMTANTFVTQRQDQKELAVSAHGTIPSA